MGLLARVSTVAPARMRASLPADADFWYPAPDGWTLPLEAAGVVITPELALTLSYVFCAVSTISDDFGTMTCQLFRNVGDEGRQRVKYSDPGIGQLASLLRWQPNSWQTAKAFWSTLCWQYLLRPAAYAEIIYRPGGSSFIDQIIPRHPDRVQQERLADGTLRYRLSELNGTFRYVTQDEMFVVRNTSTDGLNAISRMRYGGRALASGLSLQDFTRNYFKKGATAALLATYKGVEMEDDEEAALHGSITRYLSGVENAGGVLLVPEDIDVKSLGVDPEKAQLLGLKELSGRDVARLFKMPPHKLFISATATFASQVQSAQEYVTSTQMPIVVEFEQAIQRDLILAQDKFFAKFNMDYLLRADLKTRMEAYQIGIQARVLRPSECRVREDLSPDPALDKLSEGDNRPGVSGGGSGSNGTPQPSNGNGKQALRHSLFVHDAASRCVRRERVAVEKLAKKHASDVERWRDELRAFYGDHATFVAETMRVPIEVARGYAAQHGTALETQGIVAMADPWERTETEALAMLALNDVDPIEIEA